MKMITRFALLGMVVIAVLFAGCGSSDDSTTDGSTAAALTKAEFVKQGNAICAKGNAEIDAGAQKLGADPSQAEIEKFATDTLVPSVEGQISQLRDLTPPEGDEDAVNAIFDAADEAVAATKDDPSVITSKDDPYAKANDLAIAYGLSVCGG